MVLSFHIFFMAENGSTWSKVNDLDGLHLSGRDSGTINMMKSTSRMATMVATATTTDSSYICSRQAPENKNGKYINKHGNNGYGNENSYHTPNVHEAFNSFYF